MRPQHRFQTRRIFRSRFPGHDRGLGLETNAKRWELRQKAYIRGSRKAKRKFRLRPILPNNALSIENCLIKPDCED
jgi:hypothetical protein